MPAEFYVLNIKSNSKEVSYSFQGGNLDKLILTLTEDADHSMTVGEMFAVNPMIISFSEGCFWVESRSGCYTYNLFAKVMGLTLFAYEGKFDHTGLYRNRRIEDNH